jgi:hypothetical protein
VSKTARQPAVAAAAATLLVGALVWGVRQVVRIEVDR